MLELGYAKSGILKSCVYNIQTKIIRKFHKQQLTKFSKDVVSFITVKKKRLKKQMGYR